MKFEDGAMCLFGLMVALLCIAMIYGAIRDSEHRKQVELIEIQKLKQCKTN